MEISGMLEKLNDREVQLSKLMPCCKIFSEKRKSCAGYKAGFADFKLLIYEGLVFIAHCM